MKQRLGFSEPQAQSTLLELKTAIRKSLPNSWRFTRHPSGFFLLYDVSVGVKYFGMSFRISPLDDQFKKDIESTLPKLNSRMDAKQWDVTISELKDKYRKIVQYPESEICHEIKTVYEPQWGIRDIQIGYEELKKSAGRPFSVKIEREAVRPNAIILKEEIWARQDVWIHMSIPCVEYLLFERLTIKGLDKACVKVFKYQPTGVLEPSTDILISAQPVYLKRKKPTQEFAGFHTENYWSLPTEIEKSYLDLLFKQRKSQRDASIHLDDKDNKTIMLIRKILDTGTMKA